MTPRLNRYHCEPASIRQGNRPCAADRRPVFECPSVRSDGVFRSAMETGRTRLLITGAMMALAFIAVAVRTADVSVFSASEEAGIARAIPSAQPMKTERADIVDRNGVVVATSLQTVSLYADPRRVIDPAEAVRGLVRVFPDMDPIDLMGKLTSDRSFIWVRRQLTPEQQFAVNTLGLPGLEFQQEESRVYPHGSLMSHVVGFTDIDNTGISAIEKSFDRRLKDSAEPLQLSVDVRLQHLVREEVGKAIKEFDAIGGTGIVMKAQTGEILSMVSLPDFDPNKPGQVSEDARFNRATLGVYELGSVFKIFNTAMALEYGVTTMRGGYDASQPIKIGRFQITDYHGENRYLTVPEIFLHSSNIGSAKMAVEVGAPAQREFLQRLGLLDPVGVELPERGHPMYPDPWRPVNTMTISYGHGISVSPLHLASAVSATVNGGWSVRPTLLKGDGSPHDAHRVMSADTSRALRQLMRANVEEGSGTKADAPGYLVGGKTGTADKLSTSGGYSRNSRISSFAAAFPMQSPEYVVYVVVDEPKGNKSTYGFATGGWVAAPVVSKIITRMAPLVGMRPFDAETPAIRQDLALEPTRAEKKLASYRPE